MIAVLEVRQRVEEDDRAAVAVAVEQGEAAAAAPRASAVRISDITGVIPEPPANADDSGASAAASNSVVKLPCGGMTSIMSPAFSLSPTQLEKTPAGDPLDGHHPVLLVGRGAQRIIAPHFLAVDVGPQRQMLAGLERERSRAARAELRSGSNWPRRSRARSRRPASAWKCSAILPDRVGIGARQILHHREQMAEMLAVMAAPAAEDRALVGRHLELRLGQHRRRSPRDTRPRTRADRRAMPRSISASQRLVDLEQFGDEAPAPVEPVAPSAARSPRCRRRGAPSIRPPARGDRRLP